MSNNLKRFPLNILIFSTDIILAFTIVQVVLPQIFDPSLSELLGDMSFFGMLLIMTFIKTIIIKVKCGIKWSIICFFLQSVLLICTPYLNVYLVGLPTRIPVNESTLLQFIVLILSPVLIWLGLFAYLLYILVLCSAIFIPFFVTVEVISNYKREESRLKVAKQKGVEKERDRIAESGTDLIIEIMDERARMDLIIDNPQTETIPNYFSNDSRYRLDENLAINKHDYIPINMTNEDKYYYYINSIQMLCTEFKDILGYNLGDVKDTHQFLLSFKKDIENYLNNINLSTNVVGIRKKEQSFIIRQRKYFIEYYLKQRLEMIIKDNYSIKLGYEGEQLVNKTLSMYHNLINLSNIRVEIDGRSVECDNIILSTKGIFILEVKNIGSSGKFKIIIEKDGRWQKKYESSQEVESMDSATSQNNAHVAYISRLLEKECVDINFDFGLNGIVVISNNNVSIENNSMYQTVLRADNVYNYISSFPTIYTKEQLEIIKQVLLKHNLDPKGYPVYQHIDELIQNINQMLNVLRKGAAVLKDHTEEIEDICPNYFSYL